MTVDEHGVPVNAVASDVWNVIGAVDQPDSPADRLHCIAQNLVSDVLGSMFDFSFQLHGCREKSYCADLSLVLLNSLAATSIRRSPVFGPFQPRNLSFLSSSSSVATKKLLDLFADLFGQIARILVGLFAVGVARHGDQPVIADGLLALLALQDFQNPDDLALQD